jgi:hypothetical protein
LASVSFLDAAELSSEADFGLSQAVMRLAATEGAGADAGAGAGLVSATATGAVGSGGRGADGGGRVDDGEDAFVR